MTILPYLRLTFTAILCSLCLFVNGQDYPNEFNSLVLKNDTIGQVNLLKKWSAANPNDPELFIAYFNYYVQKSRSEVISIGKEQAGNESLEISDTGTGKTVGYMGLVKEYDNYYLKQWLAYIDKGIALNPNRLDMRFGKIYMLGEVKNYPDFAKQIEEAIDYNAQIKSKWAWKDGKPLEDATNFFLSAVQDYVNTLYNSGNEQLPLMRAISEKTLTYYPSNVESLSNIAITYLLTDDYDKALGYLLKAEAINPKDGIVLGNIAEAYSRKKDKKNAAVYYNKMIKEGSADEAEYAKDKLKSLN